jgi:hypothetical protein
MAERKHIADLRHGSPSYEEDYAAWLDTQIALMRADRWADVDKANLLDEVESLGRSDFKSFVSAIRIVLIHMLKWDYQPERRTRSWQASIVVHRKHIEDELTDSPSYMARITEAMKRAYSTARAEASGETDLPMSTFPQECPYDWDTIMTREHPLDEDN